MSGYSLQHIASILGTSIGKLRHWRRCAGEDRTMTYYHARELLAFRIIMAISQELDMSVSTISTNELQSIFHFCHETDLVELRRYCVLINREIKNLEFKLSDEIETRLDWRISMIPMNEVMDDLIERLFNF